MVRLHWKRRKARLMRWQVKIRKLAKYINCRDAESDQVPLELATMIWHSAEERSGYKSRCWLHSMRCRCVD